MNAPALTRPGRWPRFPERTVVLALRVLLGLVLLTPLVVGSELVYPFVVGKAVYSRTLIAVAFAAWAALALARPAWRPPRSVLLALLGVYGGVAVLAGVTGVSPQHSVWSYYGRMEGLFDLAHWLAFAVVAASVLRTRRDWAWVLGAALAVGLAIALAALAQVLTPGLLPLPAVAPGSQAYGTLGNAGYLGACLQATAALAAGGFVVALLKGRAPLPTAPEVPARPGNRRRTHRAAPVRRPRPWWLLTAAACAATFVVSLWALGRSGSMGGLAGLVTGGAGAALLLAAFTRMRRPRVAGLAAIAVLATVPLLLGGVLAWRSLAGDAGHAPVFGVRLLDRITSPYDLEVSMGSRFDNWRAGIDAFAARPVLGWGTGNYLVASGRHVGPDAGRYLVSKGTVNEGLDHAHNTLVEEAATKGALGLLAYLALWTWTGLVVVRAARRATGADRVAVACVGWALAGWFVQSQTLFYSASSWLVHMLLLAYLARRDAGFAEAAGKAWAAPPDPPGRPGTRRMALRWTAGAAAAALAAGSVAANGAMHAGAAALYRAEKGPTGEFMAHLQASIRAFEPMATHGRVLLFENVAPNWVLLRRHVPAEALRLLAWADRAAPKALAAEPENWQLHHSLAHLYREVAKTEPGYADLAARFDASARAATPHLDPMLPMQRPERR